MSMNINSIAPLDIATKFCSPKSPKETWRDVYEKIPRCNQRQDSVTEQLRDLQMIANRLGFYDAADFIKNSLEQQNEPIAESH